MTTVAEKNKVKWFKNVSRYCTVGAPPGAANGLDVQVHGLPFYFPPGKIVHDEHGTIFPLLQSTGQRYFVQCDHESEMTALGVPESARVPGGFRGVNFIMKQLTEAQAGQEKDRASLTIGEYDALKERADAGAKAIAEAATANAMVVQLQADLAKAQADKAQLTELEGVKAELQRLSQMNSALQADLAKITAERDKLLAAISSRPGRRVQT